LKVYAGGASAGLAHRRQVELVDPRGNAIDRLSGQLRFNRHLFAALARTPQLCDEMRARRITGDDSGRTPAQSRFASEELELQSARLQVQTARAIHCAMTAAGDAAWLKDLCRERIEAVWTRRARTSRPSALFFTAGAERDQKHQPELSLAHENLHPHFKVTGVRQGFL
jgi:hypothetical protein